MQAWKLRLTAVAQQKWWLQDSQNFCLQASKHTTHISITVHYAQSLQQYCLYICTEIYHASFDLSKDDRRAVCIMKLPIPSYLKMQQQNKTQFSVI